MDALTILLLVLPVAMAVGTPVYMIFRERMEEPSEKTPKYTRRRIFKLTIVNLLINLLGAAYFVLLFLAVAPFPSFDTQSAVLSFLLFLAIAIASFGAGIHLASIAIDAYTTPDLREDEDFETQFLAINLFHGPISHVLAYSSWLAAGVFIGFLEILQTPSGAAFPFWAIAAGGGVAGVMFAVAQIYNRSAPYHLPTAGILSLAYFGTAVSLGVNPFTLPAGTFFSVFLVLFDIMLALYLVWRLVRRPAKLLGT